MSNWKPTAPDETKSVQANKIILQANTTYIETEMNKDHFWDIGEDEDGHHKYAQMPKYTDGAVATPTSPTLATGMDLAFFSRLKTATEATAQQDVQPYARNADSIMQLLGIRAMAVFNVPAGVLTTVYSHNCSVAKDGEGRFTASFTPDLPSVNYCFLGGGVGYEEDTSSALSCAVESSLTLGTVKTISMVKFRTILSRGEATVDRHARNPVQAWFVVFGG